MPSSAPSSAPSLSECLGAESINLWNPVSGIIASTIYIEDFQDGTVLCQSQISTKNFEAVVNLDACLTRLPRKLERVYLTMHYPDGSTLLNKEKTPLFMMHSGNEADTIPASPATWASGSYLLDVVVKYLDGTPEMSITRSFTVTSC